MKSPALTAAIACTLSATLALFIPSSPAQDATAAQTSSKVDPTPYTVQERALNHRIMSRVIQTTDAEGKTITKTNSYTELATGLHYLQDGKLLESKAEITLLPQGGASATQGQHKAYFPANLNGGVIDLVMPDGRELKSQVRGLGYYDKATGKNVILAEVRDTEGTLYPPNVIVYENAFNGVRADVRYTYRRSGFEQDVILREQPPTPKQLGLDPETTRLEVMTEFIESPTPSKRTVGVESKASGADQSLHFGAMTIVRGRAFSIGEPSRTNRPVSVSKSWEQIEGRPFLIEQVDYNQMYPKINTLPKPPQGASINNPGKKSKIGRLASGRQMPARNLASKKPKSLQLAKATEAIRPGFLLDYPIQIVSENNFTLEERQTYYVVGDGPGGAILTGQTTIKSGAVIKSRFDDPYQGIDQYVLLLEDTDNQACSLSCTTTPNDPAVFTDWCDDSVGEVIDESSGSPNGTYPWVLTTFGGGTSSWQYKNLKFKHGQPSIFVGNTTTTTSVNVQNCQFLDITVDGIVAQVANSGSIALKNSLFSLDGTAVSIVGSSVGFNGENITSERFATFVTGTGSPNIKDSLFIGGGQIGGTPTFTSTKSSSAGIFQSGSLGNYYLNPNDTWVAQNLIDQGSQTSPSAALDNFTTRVDNTWDNGRVDRGFHYPGFINLQASCNNPKIVLTWTLPQWLSQLGSGYISDFRIYRCDSTSGSCTPATLYATVSNPSATSFDDTSVVAGHTYCYRITFRHQVGSLLLESPFSNTSCSTLCCHSGDGDNIWVDSSPSAADVAGYIMAGTGANIVSGSAQFSGDASAHGIFGNGTAAGLPIDKGAILASGAIANAAGPNNAEDATTEFYGGTYNGDADLEKLVGNGSNTRDAVSLEFDFTSTSAFTWQVQYIYASDEYPEYIANSGGFNDPMAIFITSTKSGNNWVINASDNIALIPSTTINVSVNTVNGGGHSKVTGTDLDPSHPEYYRDNHDPNNSPRPQYAAPSQIYNIQYDGITAETISGVTTGLTATKSISANVTYHVKIAIADFGDAKYDSGVIIKASIPCPQ